MRAFELGQKASTARTVTEQDVEAYRLLCGDMNPIYTDADSSQRAGFDQPIVPCGLVGGMFSDLLGTELPGRGTNWLKQSLNFCGAAYVGEKLTATVEVVRLRPDKDLVNLRTVCVNEKDDVVCEGEALVLVKEMEARGERGWVDAQGSN